MAWCISADATVRIPRHHGRDPDVGHILDRHAAPVQHPLRVLLRNCGRPPRSMGSTGTDQAARPRPSVCLRHWRSGDSGSHRSCDRCGSPACSIHPDARQPQGLPRQLPRYTSPALTGVRGFDQAFVNCHGQSCSACAAPVLFLLRRCAASYLQSFATGATSTGLT